MKIPKRFKILGNTIKVKYEKDLCALNDVYGFAEYRVNILRLQKVMGIYTKGKIKTTFYHEMVHFILDAMGENELKSNEKFVGLFADILYQVEKTSEY
jgi:hypothetical protein